MCVLFYLCAVWVRVCVLFCVCEACLVYVCLCASLDSLPCTFNSHKLTKTKYILSLCHEHFEIYISVVRGNEYKDFFPLFFSLFLCWN